jgi:GNAT superfamily N-acetyltransferase
MIDSIATITYAENFDDTAQLATLYAAAQLGRRRPDEIAAAFRSSRYRIFALQGEHLVGAARAFGDEIDCAVICDMAVRPDLQGRGIGECMLEALKHRTRHHLRVILYAKPGKEGFYRKRGFDLMKTAMLWSSRVPADDNRTIGLIA